MPRLLRRLAAFLEADAAGKIKYRQTRKREAKEHNLPDRKLLGQPYIRARDRKRSLILDLNPIIDKSAFYTPRELPPVLPSPSRQKERVNGRRLMTPVEVEAMASPYARMLSSPLRTCLFTRAILPQDLLIRFGGVHDPDTKQKYLMPNNIEHPKFSKHVGGKNFWISCWKEAVRQTMITGKHAMAIPQLEAHSLLLEQVEQMLQQRLIQELEILLTRLTNSRHIIGDQQERILRRLSREELYALFQSSASSLHGVSAIIIGDVVSSQALALPAFQLIKDTSAVGGSRVVPFYNMNVVLSSDNLARANTLFCDLYNAEANIDPKASGFQLSKGDDNTCNAYLLVSTPNTMARADTVPISIALWRLRLWAGQGWNGGLWGNWEKKSLT
ncbi:hypothetical protein CPB86DRAFT_812792 [Serendipita vermifera]|nr:hypothetical protein CPB86DRAFT_812792 [Serendipita vermifera]